MEAKVQIKDEEHKRARWSGKLQFLMSCISVSVGLGNVWRFPFTAYENGGGAFIIPYIVVLFLIGKPMYFIEALMGQFTQQGVVKMWSVCPAYLGIGVGVAYSTTAVISYYAALLALDVYYLIISCQANLPWDTCDKEWGDLCVNSQKRSMRGNDQNPDQLRSSSELYFLNTVLQETNDISTGIGMPNWKLALALFAVWTCSFLVILRGIRTWGRVSYFFAVFPFVTLFMLLIRAVTLDGAKDGIIFFFKPDWGELLNPKVWRAAVVQCFFSLGVSFGAIVTFSSHNTFDHPIWRDTMIVTTVDTFVSLMAGVTIFGILGNLAKNLKVDSIDEVVRSGLGLAFISYPDAISKFDFAPQLFAVLFFALLFVLGVGSLAGLSNAVITACADHFKVERVWILSGSISFACFLVGLVYITPGGQWVLNLVDYYAGTYVVFVLAFFEVIGITWLYGLRNFCDDVYFMTGDRVSFFFRICWIFITPTLLIIIFTYSMAIAKPIDYGGSRYPLAGDISGWAMFALGWLQIPFWAIVYCCKHKEDTFAKTVKAAHSPNANWGPTDSELHAKWITFKQDMQQSRELERNTRHIGIFRQKVMYVFGCSK